MSNDEWDVSTGDVVDEVDGIDDGDVRFSNENAIPVKEALNSGVVLAVGDNGKIIRGRVVDVQEPSVDKGGSGFKVIFERKGVDETYTLYTTDKPRVEGGGYPDYDDNEWKNVTFYSDHR